MEVTGAAVLITTGFALNEQMGAAFTSGELLQERKTLPV